MIDTDAVHPDILNILVAVPYLNKQMLAALGKHSHEARFLLDSGAFTAWKAGKTTDVDTYCKLLDELPIKPWRYFALDVIGDPAGTIRNYETMLRRGYNPIPVFTRGEDPSVIDDFYKTSDIVGIGGLVGTKGGKGFINGIMRHIGKRYVHWLGFTKTEYILHYKPYSCDSSSYCSSLIFGTCKMYIGSGKYLTFRKKDFISHPGQAIIDALHLYKLDPALFKSKAQWVNSGRFRNAIEHLTYRSAVWANRELERASGTRIFFATVSDHHLYSMVHGLEFLRTIKPSLFATTP
jgi:hypothetical protein